MNNFEDFPSSSGYDPYLDPSDSEQEYEVERVLGRRRRQGCLQYLVKWNGFPNSENSWEPAEKLNCPYLIRAYNNRRKKELAARRSQKTIDLRRKRKTVGRPRKTAPIKEREQESMVGKKKKKVRLQEYLEPDKILGVSEYEDGYVKEYHVKWKNEKGSGLMNANEVKDNFPSLVIDYYEKSIVFQSE